jgi:hypothetical protein
MIAIPKGGSLSKVRVLTALLPQLMHLVSSFFIQFSRKDRLGLKVLTCGHCLFPPAQEARNCRQQAEI